MRLIATSSFHYGRKGPHDHEAPVIHRGEEFEVLGTSQASPTEVARYLQSRGTAVTREVWDKRSPKSDENWAWAQAEVARMNRERRA